VRGRLAADLAAVEVTARSQWAVDLGALGGTRTPSLLIRSQMLYPLSYERRCPDSLRYDGHALYQAFLAASTSNVC